MTFLIGPQEKASWTSSLAGALKEEYLAASSTEPSSGATNSVAASQHQDNRWLHAWKPIDSHRQTLTPFRRDVTHSPPNCCNGHGEPPLRQCAHSIDDAKQPPAARRRSEGACRRAAWRMATRSTRTKCPGEMVALQPARSSPCASSCALSFPHRRSRFASRRSPSAVPRSPSDISLPTTCRTSSFVLRSSSLFYLRSSFAGRFRRTDTNPSSFAMCCSPIVPRPWSRLSRRPSLAFDNIPSSGVL